MRKGAVALALLGLCGLALGACGGKEDRSHRALIATGPPPPGAPAAGCAVNPGASLWLNAPDFVARAGAGALVKGCAWFPSSTCSNKVTLTLKAAGKEYALGGAVRPTDSFFAFPKPQTSSRISGFVSIPEAVNLGTQPVQAKVYGSQEFDFGLPVLGCVKILGKSGGPGLVTILPATTDSSVITNVTPVDQSGLLQGQPLKLTWKLSRAGEVRIRLWFDFTAEQSLSVRPGAFPADAIFDAQRPAGANELVFALASPEGKAFPPGQYHFQIELLDPAGSSLVPAAPKGASFTLALA